MAVHSRSHSQPAPVPPRPRQAGAAPIQAHRRAGPRHSPGQVAHPCSINPINTCASVLRLRFHGEQNGLWPTRPMLGTKEAKHPPDLRL